MRKTTPYAASNKAQYSVRVNSAAFLVWFRSVSRTFCLTSWRAHLAMACMPVYRKVNLF